MQSLQILYTFVLRAAEIATIFGPNVVGIPHAIQKYTKVAKGSKAIFSACYNISQPNFVILLIFSMLFLAVPVVIYLHLHVPSFKISL